MSKASDVATRISPVEASSASTEVKEIYEHRLGGKPGSVHKLMAHQPKALTAFLAFYSSVGRSLGRRLYELVYIRVSMINRCNYCMQHHLASSKKAEITPQEWAALKNVDYSGFSEAEQTALRFAEKLTLTPHEISDADFDGLKKHFNEDQIVDLDLLVGVINLTNRFTDPLGAELEFPAEKI